MAVPLALRAILNGDEIESVTSELSRSNLLALLFAAGIFAGSEELTRFVPTLAGLRKAHLRVSAKAQLFLAPVQPVF